MASHPPVSHETKLERTASSPKLSLSKRRFELDVLLVFSARVGSDDGLGWSNRDKNTSVTSILNPSSVFPIHTSPPACTPKWSRSIATSKVTERGSKSTSPETNTELPELKSNVAESVSACRAEEATKLRSATPSLKNAWIESPGPVASAAPTSYRASPPIESTDENTKSSLSKS